MKPTRFMLLTLLLSGLYFISPAQTGQLLEKTFLWRINGNGLSQSSYLYGTMHLQDKRLFYFSDSLYQYLSTASGFALEVNPDTMITSFLNDKAEEKPSPLLKDKLSPPDYQKLKKKMKEVGLTPDGMTMREAYDLSQDLIVPRSKNEMETFMDAYLYGIAASEGKEVTGLEKVETQMDMLHKEATDFNPMYLIECIDQGKVMVGKMIDIYLSHDLNKIDSITKQENKHDTVLTKRNLVMLHSMDSLMHVRSFFVAVGAAHLPGDAGLIALLRQKGYTVSPVLSDKQIAPGAYAVKTVDRPWVKVDMPEEGYIVEMPGKPSRFGGNGDAEGMNMFPDIMRSAFYGVMSIPLAFDSTRISVDSVVSLFLKGTVKKAKDAVFKKERIRQDSLFGEEVYYFMAKQNTYIRTRYLFDGRQMYLVMFAEKDSSGLNGKDVDRFFQSFKTRKVQADYKRIVNEQELFSIALPGKPRLEKTVSADSSQWVHTYKSTNKTGSLFFIQSVALCRPNYNLVNDSVYLKLVLKSYMNVEGFEQGSLKRKDTVFDHHGASLFRARIKGDGDVVDMLGMLVFRGNLAYTIIALGDTAVLKTENLQENYFSTFELLPYKQGAWGRWSLPANELTTWAPDNLRPLPKEEERPGNDAAMAVNYYAYDTSMATTFIVFLEPLNPYRWLSSDTGYLLNRVMTDTANGYKLAGYHFLNRQGVPGISFVLHHPNASTSTLGQAFLNGTTYVLQKVHVEDRDSANVNVSAFFDSLSFVRPQPPVQLLTNTPARLYNDLDAADDSVAASAREAVSQLFFEEKDVPGMFAAAMHTYREDTISYIYPTNALLAKARLLVTEQSLPFLDSTYKYLPADKEEYRYDVLNLVAHINTPNAMNELVALLRWKLPTAGNASLLVSPLSDSLALTKKIYPGLMQFAGDSLLGNRLFYLYATLLEDSILPADSLRRYEDKFMPLIATAASRLMKQGAGNAGDYQSWNMMTVLGYLNDAAAHKQLDQFVRSDDSQLKYKAASELLTHGQAVPMTVWNQLAADKVWRTSLYDLLQNEKKLSLFPKQYLTQEAMAEGYLYDGFSDEEDGTPVPYKATLIGKRAYTFEKKQQYFYLYKLVYKQEDDNGREKLVSYLGVSGPFTAQGVSVKNNIGGRYGQETLNMNRVDAQAKIYLKEWEDYYARKANDAADADDSE